MAMTKLKFEHYVLIILVVLTTFSVYLGLTSLFNRKLRDGSKINAVLIGTDWVDYARHSDTLIFLSYNPTSRFLDIVSIPRDTHFSPPGYAFNKINEIYAYHFRTKKNDHIACKEVTNAVEKLLLDKVTIPFYVRVDYSCFKKLINILGGINIEIDEPMHYDDVSGKLHIHFDPGTHHLDGKQALEYVRYRGAAGDIGRIFRQQRFMKAVVSKWKNPLILFRLPQILYVIAREIDTNLSFWDIIAGGLELKDLKTKNIRFAQLPGAVTKRFWEPDVQDTISLFDKIFPSSGTVTNKTSRIKVEVWNASGKNKLAEKVSWILRKHGYDVVDWGNFSVRQKKTLIKDLTGNLRPAQKISEIISCSEVVTRYDTKRFVDISIILGEDCDLKKIPKK